MLIWLVFRVQLLHHRGMEKMGRELKLAHRPFSELGVSIDSVSAVHTPAEDEQIVIGCPLPQRNAFGARSTPATV